MDKETLRFQARVLCKPPLEADKENDLLKILDRRIEQRTGKELNEGESLEESVSKTLAQTLADKWIYRLPDKEWYKYADGHWSTHDGACYEIMSEIEDALMKIREKVTSINRKLPRRNFLTEFCYSINNSFRFGRATWQINIDGN